MPHYNVYRRSVSGLLFRRIFHKIHPSRKSEISTVTLTERRAFKSGQKLSLAELLYKLVASEANGY